MSNTQDATKRNQPKQLTGVQSLAVIGCILVILVSGAIMLAFSFLMGTGKLATATIGTVQPQAETLLRNTQQHFNTSPGADDDLLAANSEAKPSERAFVAEEAQFEAASGPLKSWKLTNWEKATRPKGDVSTNLIRLRYDLKFEKAHAIAAFTFASEDPSRPETRISRCLFGADDSSLEKDNSNPVPK